MTPNVFLIAIKSTFTMDTVEFKMMLALLFSALLSCLIMSEITISYLNATNDNNRSATTTARTTKTHSQPVEETVSVTVSSLYFLSAGSGTLRVVVLHRSTMYVYLNIKTDNVFS